MYYFIKNITLFKHFVTLRYKYKKTIQENVQHFEI